MALSMMQRAFLVCIIASFAQLAACSTKSDAVASDSTAKSAPASYASPQLTHFSENSKPEPDAAQPMAASAVPADMALVSGTEFFMGIDAQSNEWEHGHLTRVKTFAIDRLEVSVAQYLECQRDEKCDGELHPGRGCNAVGKPVRLNHPMNCVLYREADSYCRAHGKRLPTSSEWELAARGTDRRPYPWGSALPGEQVCWQGRKGRLHSRTCPVGSFPQGASPYGVLDMSGNVAELTSTVLEGAFPPPIYAVRGGDYQFDPVEDPEWSIRRIDFSASASGNPLDPQPNVGFRCAADVVGK
jgi:formylglycine-generating enzyme required for sulfatase activity